MNREPIPDPRTPEQTLLGVLARRQDETNDLLRQILDRLPTRPEPERADGTVELREPKPPATSSGGGKREPAGRKGSPRPASRRQPAKRKTS